MINEFVKFFTNSTHSYSSRLIGFIIVLSLLFFIDNMLGFSYYYNINQKINQIERIENIKKHINEDSELLKNLKSIERDVIRRENVLSKFTNLFTKESLNGQNNNIYRSRILHTISSSFLFILLLILVPFFLFYQEKRINSNFVLATIFSTITFAFLIWLFQHLLGFIPVIWGNPIYNYILNAIVNVIVFAILYVYVVKGKSKYTKIV